MKETLKEIKKVITNQTFLMDDPEKGQPVKPCMDIYKVNIQYYGSLETLKLIIVVRGDLQNKEMTRDTWSPTSSISTIKYLLSDDSKHKSIVPPPVADF